MPTPVITVPGGLIVLPATATAVTGISIAESGAGPTTEFTTTVSATGTLTATGTGVSGSATSTITIAGTSAQTNTALATLQITESSTIYSTDTITVNSHDASNNAATPEQIAIVSDGHKYLTFATLAAARTRSQTQALALGCDGVKTIYWWPAVATATGGAVQIAPGDSCFDAVIAAACGITKSHPGATAVTGLTPTEQTELVTASNAGFAAPTISGGVVVP
jgi:hypothetical protein